MKTLRTLFKQDKEAFVVPKGIQDVIPVTRIWQDGIFQVGKNKYSKCYRFTDINYAVASRADKVTEIFNDSEYGNFHDISHLDRLFNNHRYQFLWGSYDDDTVYWQALKDGKRNIAGPWRTVDEH